MGVSFMKSPSRPDGPRTTRVRGFSLIDVLVSISIVTLLIGLLAPSLSKVRETTRRAVCASNQRQLGIGVHEYANENDEYIPQTVFLEGRDLIEQREVVASDMVMIRLGQGGLNSRGWDGLGLLFAGDFLPASPVFYCPSHQGDHPLDKYQPRFSADAPSMIVSNYQYRGEGPNGSRRLFQLLSGVALVSDALAGESYFNHEGGFNVLSADHSVSWMPDRNGDITRSLSTLSGGGAGGNETIQEAWRTFDGLGPLSPIND